MSAEKLLVGALAMLLSVAVQLAVSVLVALALHGARVRGLALGNAATAA